ERFPEGRGRIAVALRELETHGYLRRVREHTPEGRLVTRTYAHHVPFSTTAQAAARAVRAVPVRSETGAVPADRAPSPGGHTADEVPEPSQEDDQRPDPAGGPDEPGDADEPGHADGPGAADGPGDADGPDGPGGPAGSPALGGAAGPVGGAELPADPRCGEAADLLSGLRRTDERLTLSARDVNRLAPSVVAWFERGATPGAVLRTLTADLPAVMKHPAGVIAYRLRETLPPPLPVATALARVTGAVQARPPRPFQDCDGCDRVFRAAEPGRCRDCRSGAAAGGVDAVARAA